MQNAAERSAVPFLTEKLSASVFENMVQKNLSVSKWCIMELQEQMEVFIDHDIGAVEIWENRSGSKKKRRKCETPPLVTGVSHSLRRYAISIDDVLMWYG